MTGDPDDDAGRETDELFCEENCPAEEPTENCDEVRCAGVTLPHMLCTVPAGCACAPESCAAMGDPFAPKYGEWNGDE